MLKLLKWFALGLPLFAAGYLPPSQRSTEGHQTAALQPADAASAVHRYVGVGSCAAGNCHGGGSARPAGPTGGIWGSEYSVWIQQDPHARAFAVLHNDRSTRMMKLLRQSPKYKRLGKATEEQLCLNCHAVAPTKDLRAPEHHLAVNDGVSCEACHGPAEHWLAKHVEHTWKVKSAAEKAKHGFRNTKDLATRAAVCADCHVGGAGKDVNHDLYAAGHPRLNFELSAYHTLMPAHWSRDKDRRRSAHEPSAASNKMRSDFEVKLWAVGQVVSAKQAIALLKLRAEDQVFNDADRPRSVWPEFAEYGCFTCHHDLQSPSWRQQGKDGRPPGSFSWTNWQYSMLPVLSQQTGGVSLGDGSEFARLESEMSKPFPNRKVVLEQARRVEADLAAWAAKLAKPESQFNAAEVRELLSAVIEAGPKLNAQGWDSAAQVYLALSPLYRGYADLEGRVLAGALPETDRAVAERLQHISRLLAFPSKETQSNSVRFDSPQSFNDDVVSEINQQLSEIHERINP